MTIKKITAYIDEHGNFSRDYEELQHKSLRRFMYQEVVKYLKKTDHILSILYNEKNYENLLKIIHNIEAEKRERRINVEVIEDE